MHFLSPSGPRPLNLMKLKFSSVQQPELIGYLALLKPENLEIEEVAGYCEAVRQ